MPGPLPAALGPLTHRVEALHLYDDEIDGLVRVLPPMPLNYAPSNAGLIALNLALHNVGTLRVANEAVLSFRTLWLNGLFTAVGLPARLLFELCGAACYAEGLADKLADRGQHSKVFERSTELFLGSRYAVPQFSGSISDVPSIHVMEFVRAAAFVPTRSIPMISFQRPVILTICNRPISGWQDQSVTVGAILVSRATPKIFLSILSRL